MKKFEYYVVAIVNDNFEHLRVELNALGINGWELVNVITDGVWDVCYFKRER